MSGVRLFAGANTAKGFFSFYNYLARDSSRRVFILKGGPGTGKSTLLKRIAEEFSSGCDVDRFYCSADVNSLDGVYIHGLDISILDGTAPHVTDPRLPGAVQQIVDLGTCWNQTELVNCRNKILETTDLISRQYKIAYKWLAVAAGQAELIQTLERPVISDNQAAADAEMISGLLPAAASGLNRQAFATAITGSGLVSFVPDLFQNTPTKVFLTGGNRAYNNTVLQTIRQILMAREIPATYLHCGLLPEYLEHIYIPGVFGLYSQHHANDCQEGLVCGPPEPGESPLEGKLSETVQHAVAALSKAQQLHMELEKIYIPQVDFDCVNSQRELIVKQIHAIKTR